MSWLGNNPLTHGAGVVGRWADLGVIVPCCRGPGTTIFAKTIHAGCDCTLPIGMGLRCRNVDCLGAETVGGGQCLVEEARVVVLE